MTQEEKELLLKDLCARLPYKVKVQYANKIYDVVGCHFDKLIMLLPFMSNLEGHPIETCKPYLRPMSSMTGKEKEEIKVFGAELSPIGNIRFRIKEDENDGFEYGYRWLDILDFLNAHHFDYRGLIPMGLALPEPEDM